MFSDYTSTTEYSELFIKNLVWQCQSPIFLENSSYEVRARSVYWPWISNLYVIGCYAVSPFQTQRGALKINNKVRLFPVRNTLSAKLTRWKDIKYFPTLQRCSIYKLNYIRMNIINCSFVTILFNDIGYDVWLNWNRPVSTLYFI